MKIQKINFIWSYVRRVFSYFNILYIFVFIACCNISLCMRILVPQRLNFVNKVFANLHIYKRPVTLLENGDLYFARCSPGVAGNDNA